MNYRHLTEAVRYQIQALRNEGIGMRGIAKRVDCAASTISRELRRNGEPERYRAKAAQCKAHTRRHAACSRPRIDAAVWVEVEARLREEHSPEIIHGRLRLEGKPTVSHERIYQYIMADRKAGGDLWKHRRHGKPRKRRLPRSVRRFRDGTPLSERPAEAANRQTLGHWEGDTMVGSGTARLLTLVERKSRFSVIQRAVDGCARTIMMATLAGLYPWQQAFPGTVASIAYDNGSEFAEHALTNIGLGCTSYFARPYASWERGTNENTNGLIRQYAPKRIDLGKLSDADVQRIADKLNDRPRKVLGFRTPREVFEESLFRLKSDQGKKQQVLQIKAT
jgi:IS30 family transposase